MTSGPTVHRPRDSPPPSPTPPPPSPQPPHVSRSPLPSRPLGRLPSPRSRGRARRGPRRPGAHISSGGAAPRSVISTLKRSGPPRGGALRARTSASFPRPPNSALRGAQLPGTVANRVTWGAPPRARVRLRRRKVFSGSDLRPQGSPQPKSDVRLQGRVPRTLWHSARRGPRVLRPEPSRRSVAPRPGARGGRQGDLPTPPSVTGDAALSLEQGKGERTRTDLGERWSPGRNSPPEQQQLQGGGDRAQEMEMENLGADGGAGPRTSPLLPREGLRAPGARLRELLLPAGPEAAAAGAPAAARCQAKPGARRAAGRGAAGRGRGGAGACAQCGGGVCGGWGRPSRGTAGGGGRGSCGQGARLRRQH